MDIESICGDGECRFELTDQRQLSGRLLGGDAQWLVVDTGQGPLLLNRIQVIAIVPPGAAFSVQAQSRPAAATSRRAGRKAPGRKWDNTELRQLADAFLDGEADTAIADRLQRTRSAIKEMHQAFECARGNLTDDQLGPVAVTWVDRWQRVLGQRDED